MTRNTSVRMSIITLALCLSTGCPKEEQMNENEKCKVWEIIYMGSEYVLVNDDYEHPRYAQCIFQNPDEQTYGWFWEAIPSDSPLAGTTTSAFIWYGELPGAGSTTPALPIAVHNISSMMIDYDLVVATTSLYDLLFETQNFYGCTVGFCIGSAYLGIYLHADSAISAEYLGHEYFQERVTIGGEDYDFYKDHWSYSSPPTTGTSYRFVKVNPSLSGTIPLHAFLHFLEEEGYDDSAIPISEITYLQCSQTMWEGDSGSTTIRNYSIDVVPHTH